MDKEIFLSEFSNLSSEDQINIWNEYARDNDSENEVFVNDEYFLDEFFEKPSDAVRAVYFGDYKYNDDYVWFNGYGNLETSSFADDTPIDADVLADYIDENPDLLDNFDGFEETKESIEREDNDDDE